MLLTRGLSIAHAGPTTCLTGTAPEVAVDPVQIAAVRALIDDACPCDGYDGSRGSAHSDYLKCAASIIKTQVDLASLRPQCRADLKKIYAASVCGSNPLLHSQVCITVGIKSRKVACTIKPSTKKDGVTATKACTSTGGSVRVFCPGHTHCLDAADRNGDSRIDAPGDDGACVVTPTPTPVATAMATSAATPTVLATLTATATTVATTTPAPPTAAVTPTSTATTSATPTPASTATSTSTVTSTSTATPDATATPSSTPVATLSATPTPTSTAIATSTPSATRTATPTPTATSTPTATRTATPTVTATKTPTPTPTSTPDTPPVVNDDTILTNQMAASGSDVISIPTAALLVNDSDADGQAISVTAISGAASGSVALGSGVVTFTEQSSSAVDGGSFTYTGSTSSPPASDTATVAVNRSQIGASSLIGTNSGEILVGRDGSNDTIDAGGGVDALFGGTGNDVLTGGTGADEFFATSTTGSDTITDYSGIGGHGDIVDLTSLFQTAAGASNATDFINYNAATGALSVDANGLTGGGSFVTIATFTIPPAAPTLRLRVRDVDGALRIITANLI